MARPAATFAAAGGLPAGSRLTAASATEQVVASAALPSIQSPPPPSGPSVGPQTLFFQSVRVPAGKIYPVVIRGNYVYVEGIFFTYPDMQRFPVTIRPDTAQSAIPLTEPFREIRFPEPFATLQIDNTRNTLNDVTISLWVGFGQVRRDAAQRITATTTGFTVAVGGAMAANQCVGAGPLKFSSPIPVNPMTQVSTLTKALLTKTTGTTLNADFTLYFFEYEPTAYAHGANFDLATFSPSYLVGQIRFPSFYAGSGANRGICDLSGISVDLTTRQDVSPPTTDDPDGTLFGVLVTNAAYTCGSPENFGLKLVLRT